MADNSIGALKEKIIKLLKDAGADGMNQPDILNKLDLQNSKMINFGLKALVKRNEIVEDKSGHWIIAGLSKGDTSETSSTPSASEELIKISLPGNVKFTSYKNTLQEYCSKKKLPSPNFDCLKEKHGLVGTVSFGKTKVKCTKVFDNRKEAEMCAAYEALKKLGYLKGDKSHDLKRKGKDNTIVLEKRVKYSGQTSNPKVLIHNYTQKHRIDPPLYTTEPVEGGFISCVQLDGKKFTGRNVCSNSKDAELEAAQVAAKCIY